jgi:hypothetical protein
MNDRCLRKRDSAGMAGVDVHATASLLPHRIASSDSTAVGSHLWQASLAIAFSKMLAVDLMAKRLRFQEFAYPELRKVGHEQTTFQAAFFVSPELRQRRSKNRTRRRAVS